MELIAVTGDMAGENGVAGHHALPITLTAGPDGGRLLFRPGELSQDQYLVLEVEGRDRDALLVMIEFFTAAGAEEELKVAPGTGLRASVAGPEPDACCMFSFIPQLPVTTYLPLASLVNQTLPRQERTPGRLRRGLWGSRIQPEDITVVSLQLGSYYRSRNLTVHRFETAAEPPDCSLKETPTLVDNLGQLTIRPWRGRSENVQEMAARLRGESREAAAGEDETADSPYGGWSGRTFTASGYFRTEHDGRRWWLVTPDGKAFYSVGVDSIRPGEAGFIKGLERLFAWLPPRDGEFAEAYQDDHYFSFAKANLMRVYGDQWWQGWADLTRARLRTWGVNTVGNWSDPDFCEYARMPYVVNLQRFPSTEALIFRDFPDVFHDDFRRGAEEYAAQLAPLKGDAYLIGYFMINEPYWAVGSATNLAREMFRTPVELASKSRLVAFLKQRYAGDVDRLNAAWQTDLLSFAEVLELSHATLPAGEVVEEDLMAFTRLMVDEYVRVPAQALSRVDPNHLNLGLRYARVSSELTYVGHEYVDVYSTNGYTFQPQPDLIEAIQDRTGKPVLIGEFHFGAPDAGLFRFGVRSVANQKDRGRAYRFYVEQGAALPALVGTHWYQYQDQPVLGRHDGEAYQIGVVDVCQRPYETFVAAMQAAHRDIYEVAAGDKRPFSDGAPALTTRWWGLQPAN